MTWSLNDLRRLKEQSFGWHNATQFLGALNDNVFKMLLQMFLISIAPADKSRTLAFATMLFALPFLLFTAYGGFISDRFSKRNVSVALKYAELAIMLAAVVAFAFSSRTALYALLFLMAAQSALFSPTKYGMVPELVPRDRLPRANSLMIIFSFMAIILGTALAPALAQATQLLWQTPGLASFINNAHEGLRYATAQSVCVVLAIMGVLTSHQLWRLRPANPDLEHEPFFLLQLGKTARKVWTDKPMTLALAGTAIFSMIAAFLQINLVRFGMDHMGYDERVSSYLFFFAAVGIASGAYIAGRISRRGIEFAILPLGSALLAATALILGLTPRYPPPVLVKSLIFLAGCGAGFYTVPLDAFFQFRLPKGSRGEVLALNSFVSWCGILSAGALLLGLNALDVAANHSFLIISVAALLLTACSLYALRGFCLRFITRILVLLIYRVRTTGMENLPLDGGALLIANHASYMDALLLSAATHRRIRFLMSRAIYERWRFLLPVFRTFGVIPVSSDESPRAIARALRTARQALDDGFLVCVFPEGGITRTGTVRAFQRGFERIAKGTDYPLIPVYMGGSWGTIYHYYQGQLVRKWLRMSLRRYNVNILFGKPHPPTASANEVRQSVIELSVDYFNARKSERASMGEQFVLQARRNWRDTMSKDTLSDTEWTWGRILIASVAMRRLLEKRIGDDEHVGILLPPCSGAMLANVVVVMARRVAVNLNFTTSREAFASSIEQCRIRTILTSRNFLERFPNLPIPEGSAVFVEDFAKAITTPRKIAALLKSRLLPARTLSRSRKAKADDVALVLFSSGSTGDPKGIMLSHHNFISMIESLRMVFATTPRDRICAALPLFHSFGILATVWYPLLSHVKVTYHTNPLDAGTIARIVREDACTLLLTTPTFLANYLRRAEPEDFKSLRFVLAGAEKLKDSTINAFEKKFGIRPLEAYGATELSPGIAVSVPHGTGGGIVHEGWRKGSVGHPLPGIATKVLDAETGELMPTGQPGLLYLKGPNLMLGYLGRPDLTQEAIRDGWYCTGDIAYVDEDGFIGITDRLSRFSKVAGEMVPHIAVEETLLNATGLAPNTLAVAGVPDEKKGEKLVVLYTAECGDPAWLWNAIEESELPNLWRPAQADYHRVEAIPLLGTGKTDLAGVRDLARQVAG